MSFKTGSLKGGLRLQRWLMALLIFLLASLLAINSFTIGQFRIVPSGNFSNQASYIDPKSPDPTFYQSKPTPTSPTSSQSPEQSGYLVNTKGCRIPALSPFEPSALRYIDRAKPIVCEQGSHLPLVESNNSAIFVNPDAKAHYYNDSEPVDCCWRSFWRTGKNDDDFATSRDCHHFEDAAFVNDEFIKVECQGRNETIYTDYFSFVPRKLYVEDRCRRQERELAAATSSNESDPLERKLSVLVVGVDAVSRLNVRRSMPQTIELLTEQMGAVEMLGYNKVADNTYPNLVPALSGLSEKEFEKLCWTNHKKYFDKCPLLWKNFAAKGYRTIFGEDACGMTTFNYLKPGFKKQPTDYYLRPFCIAAEDDIGNTHKLNAHLCLGTRLNFEQLLHYTRKVADEFADEAYFGFFWQASLTHDFIEYPQLGDDSYYEFFAYLDKYNLLRNTALVFMSDHGMRWGSFRQTYQGRLEDSLPFVYVRLPDWWKEKYPLAWDTLRINTRSLTTPYDLHETLRDLLDPARLSDQDDENNIPRRKSSRGISMFQPIPDDRTCESAGIPEHWCMCHNRRNVSRDDPTLPKITSFIVHEINAMLVQQPKCAQLEFNSLIDAKALSNAGDKRDDKKDDKKDDDGDKSAPWIDYSVTFQTQPGGAIFEGSARHRTDNGSLSLVGSISRLNAYGNQSACVDDFHMRLYCYCQTSDR